MAPFLSTVNKKVVFVSKKNKKDSVIIGASLLGGGIALTTLGALLYPTASTLNTNTDSTQVEIIMNAFNNSYTIITNANGDSTRTGAIFIEPLGISLLTVGPISVVLGATFLGLGLVNKVAASANK